MKCPHCLVQIHARVEWCDLGEDIDGEWAIKQFLCPNAECKKWIIYLVNGTDSKRSAREFDGFVTEKKSILVYPKGSNRPPAPSQVPKDFAEDYSEACIVLLDSPKASAALSRRCLQNLLREVGKVKHSNLVEEIKEIIDRKVLPSYIVKVLDNVRVVGNFAAHPIKSEKTGEIIPVEPWEAEWNLDVIEALFDFYFVQPSIIDQKKKALEKKIKEAGKKGRR